MRDPKSSLDRLPDAVEFNEREMAVATGLVEQMTIPWEPERYRDSYRDAVLELAKAKEDGQEVTVAAPVKEDSKVVDLTAALERSIAAAKERRNAAAGGSSSTSSAGSSSTSSKGGKGDDKKDKKESPKSGDDYSDLSREELYERAQKLKIPGRSKMSRDELAGAVAEAEEEVRAAS